MILKIKYQKLILRVLGLVMIVLICVLVNHLESKKPEIEIRKSITGINIYNGESKLVDLLQFNYKTAKHYILTCTLQSYGDQTSIIKYYQRHLDDIGWNFMGESEYIDYSSNIKTGDSFVFAKENYELIIYFNFQDLCNNKKDDQKNLLKYSVSIYPKP